MDIILKPTRDSFLGLFGRKSGVTLSRWT